ncbi:7540_t:CDS:2, partial [Paraglomus occultum]
MDQNTSLEPQVDYDAIQPTKLQVLLELEKVTNDSDLVSNQLQMHLRSNHMMRLFCNAIKKSWNIITNWMHPRNEQDTKPPKEVMDGLDKIKHFPIAEKMLEWYLDTVCEDFEKEFDERLKQWRKEWVCGGKNH